MGKKLTKKLKKLSPLQGGGVTAISREIKKGKDSEKKKDKMRAYYGAQAQAEYEGRSAELTSEMDRLGTLRKEAREGALSDAKRGLAYGGDFEGELFSRGVDSEAGARARGLRAGAVNRINALRDHLGLPAYEEQSDRVSALAARANDESVAEDLGRASAEDEAKRAGTYADTEQFKRGQESEAQARARGIRYAALKKAGKLPKDEVTPNTPY